MVTKTKYLLRIDNDLKLYIARQARLNNRSLNQEINHRLSISMNNIHSDAIIAESKVESYKNIDEHKHA